MNLHEHTSPARSTLSHIYKRKFKTGEKRHKQHSRNGTEQTDRPVTEEVRPRTFEEDISRQKFAILPTLALSSNPWKIGFGRGGKRQQNFSHTKAPEESCFYPAAAAAAKMELSSFWISAPPYPTTPFPKWLSHRSDAPV